MHNNIGHARRSYAERHGKFTQEDAAAFFGVSLSTYKKWEQGQGMLNGEQLRAIAEKYETTVDYLLRRIEYAVVSIPADKNKANDESNLLNLYRKMNDEGKSRLMEQATFLAERHPLNESVSVRSA